MKIVNENGKGSIYYGLHFYPGLAEYQEPEKQSYRIFLNEDTLRAMDPSFAGRPVFVEHVDEVEGDINELRKEADGWVIESFFNGADGKHWVRFITVTDRAERAIKNGMRLSNAYFPKAFSSGGLWNGISYEKQVTQAEYEHLAIVSNPRYQESVIMTPEEFKKYNEDKTIELKKLSNSKGESKMGLSFFKKAKVENAADLETMSVKLPKSGKEISITALVNEADEKEMKKNDEVHADPSHKVKLHDGSMCNVGELLEKHKALHDELEALKKDALPEKEDEHKENKEEAVVEEKHNEEGEDEDAKKKALELAAHEEKEIKAKKNAHFNSLKNAHKEALPEVSIDLMEDQVARGQARYGSK